LGPFQRMDMSAAEKKAAIAGWRLSRQGGNDNAVL
jgi:hypothetical protein